MKRTCILFLVMVFVVAVLSGCTLVSNEDALISDSYYEVLIYDFSDSVTAVEHSLEYRFWHDNKPDSEKIAPNATIEINGDILCGQFNNFVNVSPDNYTKYQYRCDDGARFATDAKGNLVSYYCAVSDRKNDQNIAQNECLKVAKDFLGNFVDPDMYQVEAKYDEYLGEYTFHFTQNIGGYTMADSAYITVSKFGKVISFNSFMMGKIPADTHIEFDQDEVIASVRHRLTALYPNQSDNYDKVEFSIEPQVVTLLDNGEVAMLVEANVDKITYVQDGSSYSISERLCFVIPQKAS